MAYPPSTTYRSATLSEAQYNADISGLAAAMAPGNINDYSASVGEMQTVANPGGVGTESLATTLAGEIERIRYQLKAITGEAQWYVAPSISLSGVTATFAAGTLMLFQQTSAPSGWTKVTTADYDDSVFRCVTGSVNDPTSTNPTRSAFLSTVMAQTNVGYTTLSTSTIPAHTHTVGFAGNDEPATAARNAANGTTGTFNSGSTGSGNSHRHTISLNIKYVDLIICSKN